MTRVRGEGRLGRAEPLIPRRRRRGEASMSVGVGMGVAMGMGMGMGRGSRRMERVKVAEFAGAAFVRASTRTSVRGAMSRVRVLWELGVADRGVSRKAGIWGRRQYRKAGNTGCAGMDQAVRLEATATAAAPTDQQVGRGALSETPPTRGDPTRRDPGTGPEPGAH